MGGDTHAQKQAESSEEIPTNYDTHDVYSAHFASNRMAHTAQISAEEVANGVGLAADELSKPCDNNIIPSLADCFSQWRVIFGSLLSELDLGDVDRDNTTEEEKRVAALRKWKTRNSYEATYKTLVDVLLNRGERSEADNLCKILVDHLSNRNGK
jgi:hypothetical protein